MSETPKRTVQEIPDGDAGIDVIVREMWLLINKDYKHPTVTNLAKKLKKSNDYDTIQSVFNHTWKNHKYVADPVDAEHLTAPRHIIDGNNPHMDCDEMVILICALLMACGIQCRILTVAWRKRDFSHVVCSAKWDGKWIILDATKKRAGFGGTVSPTEPKFWRIKKYKNPMGNLVKLDDCGGCKSKRGRGQHQNVNINIGNSLKPGGGQLVHGSPQQQVQQLPPQIKYVNKPHKVYVPMPTASNTVPGLVHYREFY